MAKKTSKKPPRNGNKQKQKQKQTVIVNINNGKTRAKRQTKKPSVIQTPQYINTFPVFQQNEPSPPLVYNVRPEPVSIPATPQPLPFVERPFVENYDYIPPRTPPQTRTRTPAVPSSSTVNLADIFHSEEEFSQTNIMNDTPRRRGRPPVVITEEQAEIIRLRRNARARELYAARVAFGL